MVREGWMVALMTSLTLLTNLSCTVSAAAERGTLPVQTEVVCER